MKLNAIISRADIKIKLARLDKNGEPILYTGIGQYENFVNDLEGGWQASKEEYIQTQKEGGRPAWVFSKDKIEMAGVAHETGLEVFLIAVAAGAAGDLVARGVGAFITWAWNKWKTDIPVEGAQEAVVILEKRKHDKRGRVIASEKIIIRGKPDEQLIKYLTDPNFSALNT